MSATPPPHRPDPADAAEENLAPYAMRARLSRGRRHPEPDTPGRGLYQRDRDRVVHSTAFRRLMHKMQVLVTQTNDHHRTRLTHTLEVAQVSRTLARRLRLNEDLTEAIALSHDLGHPPFGHAGEAALAECMRGHGGFEHNRHALRIAEHLEYPYPDFPGLNLSWEVREAMAQHSKTPDAPELAAFTAAGRPLLEAQVADAADSVAYNAHDIDDALSVGLIEPDDLGDVQIGRRAVEDIRRRHGPLRREVFQPTLVRTLIDWQVQDLLAHTQAAVERGRVGDVGDVRGHPGPLVGLSPEALGMQAELEGFLRDRVYYHPRVQRMAVKGGRVVRALFDEFRRNPRLMPERYGRRAAEGPAERVVCDYVAGMTDRYAQDEYLRLFQPFTVV